MKTVSQLIKTDMKVGLELISKAGTPGRVSRITAIGEIVQYPKTHFAIVDWENGKTSFLDMNALSSYNQVEVK